MRGIGQYQVFEKLGRGAGGIVYRALDPAVGRSLAIKELRLPQLAPSEIPEARQRFIREAQAVGNLRHDNIVTLYQFLEEQGSLYLVMEFVPIDEVRTLVYNRRSSSNRAAGRHRSRSGARERHRSQGHKAGQHSRQRPSDRKPPDGQSHRFRYCPGLIGNLDHERRFAGHTGVHGPGTHPGIQRGCKSDQFSLAVVTCQLLARRLPFAERSVFDVQIVNNEPLSLLEANPNLPREAD